MARNHIRESDPLCYPPELVLKAVQVGLDMVNIQVPLQVLEQEIAERIEWVYSNMYASPFPPS